MRDAKGMHASKQQIWAIEKREVFKTSWNKYTSLSVTEDNLCTSSLTMESLQDTPNVYYCVWISQFFKKKSNTNIIYREM